MGFRIEPTEYRLIFADARLNGLVVQAKSVSIGRFMEITGLPAAVLNGGVSLKDDAVVRDPLLQALAEVVTSWNLDDEKGKPVPPGYDALREQEPWVVRELAKAWMEAVSGVSGPLLNGSGSPGPSPESLIPMEAPSPSQQS